MINNAKKNFKLARWKKWKKVNKDERKERFTVSHRGGNLNRTRFKSALEWCWRRRWRKSYETMMIEKKDIRSEFGRYALFFRANKLSDGEKMEKSENVSCLSIVTLSFSSFISLLAHSACMHPKKLDYINTHRHNHSEGITVINFGLRWSITIFLSIFIACMALFMVVDDATLLRCTTWNQAKKTKKKHEAILSFSLNKIII